MRTGAGGRTPKRSNARAGHRTKAEQPDKVDAPGAVVMPEPDPDWHREAVTWYESLNDSGQSHWFEPSDWQHARVLARMLSELLGSSRPSSELFKAWLSGAQELGVTEAARRRMKIEVERPRTAAGGTGSESSSDGKVTAMSRYRRAASG